RWCGDDSGVVAALDGDSVVVPAVEKQRSGVGGAWVKVA
nr:hypothetical protein [Tanacetum cinerariifolium]